MFFPRQEVVGHFDDRDLLRSQRFPRLGHLHANCRESSLWFGSDFVRPHRMPTMLPTGACAVRWALRLLRAVESETLDLWFILRPAAPDE